VIVATGKPIVAEELKKKDQKSGNSSKGLDLVKPLLIGVIIISSIGIIVFLSNLVKGKLKRDRDQD
jgi:competence protein ComGC